MWKVLIGHFCTLILIVFYFSSHVQGFGHMSHLKIIFYFFFFITCENLLFKMLFKLFFWFWLRRKHFQLSIIIQLNYMFYNHSYKDFGPKLEFNLFWLFVACFKSKICFDILNSFYYLNTKLLIINCNWLLLWVFHGKLLIAS